MKLDVYVLRPLMEHLILHQMDGALIITEYLHLVMHIPQLTD